MKQASNIENFTNVETIYTKRICTVKIKLNPEYVASPDAELETVGSPYEVYEVLQAIFATLDEDQEHFILLVLNSAGLRGYKVISSGGQDATIIDRKVLFRNALLLGASSIVLAHNHPSGLLEPSLEDLDITAAIVQGGYLIDIEVLDHIIYTENGYTSIRKAAPHIFESN